MLRRITVVTGARTAASGKELGLDVKNTGPRRQSVIAVFLVVKSVPDQSVSGDRSAGSIVVEAGVSSVDGNTFGAVCIVTIKAEGIKIRTHGFIHCPVIDRIACCR